MVDYLTITKIYKAPVKLFALVKPMISIKPPWPRLTFFNIMHSQLITSDSIDETKIVKSILSIVMMMADVEDLQHRSVYFPWYNNVRNVIYIYKNSSSAGVIFFSWALPNTNCHSPSKKHVKKIFDFMCELKAITFSHYCMPGWTKLFVHAFFYHFCSSLKT